MLPSRTRPTLGATGALLLALLAGCGGQDDSTDETGTPPAESSSPTASDSVDDGTTGEPQPGAPAVGVFATTTTITKSTVPGKDSQAGQSDEMTVVLSCADTACDTVHMRSDLSEGPSSRTYLLTRTGAVLEGSGVRTGPCTQSRKTDAKGDFTETVEWSLEVVGSDLRGTFDYEFVGCGYRNTTSSSKVEGTRRYDEPSYLPADAVADLGPAIDAYDQAVATLYDQGNTCLGQPPTQAAPCLRKVLQPWSATFDPLQDAVETAGGSASPLCRGGLDALDLEGLHEQVKTVLTGLEGDAAARARTLGAPNERLIGDLSEEHVKLVTAIAVCIDPAATGDLGDDGVLAVDVVNSRLPVLPVS